MTSEQQTVRHSSCSRCHRWQETPSPPERHLGPGASGALALTQPPGVCGRPGSDVTVALLPSAPQSSLRAKLTGRWQRRDSPQWVWKPSHSGGSLAVSSRCPQAHRGGASRGLGDLQGESDQPTLTPTPPSAPSGVFRRGSSALGQLSPESPLGQSPGKAGPGPHRSRSRTKAPPHPPRSEARRPGVSRALVADSHGVVSGVGGPRPSGPPRVPSLPRPSQVVLPTATSTPSLGSGPLPFPPQSSPATRADVWPTRPQLHGGLPHRPAGTGQSQFLPGLPHRSGDGGGPGLHGWGGGWCQGQGSQPSGSREAQ